MNSNNPAPVSKFEAIVSKQLRGKNDATDLMSIAVTIYYLNKYQQGLQYLYQN